jgi:polysaccharide biosynthesis transport protein
VTLGDHLKILRERWIIIVVAIAIGLAAATTIWFVRPKEFTADLTMYVSAQTADSTQSAFQGAQLSQERVTSYVRLVTSPRVIEQVARDLRLPESPIDLAEQVTASSALDSVLIDVAVEDRSPERAAAIANAIGRVFTGLVAEIERPTAIGAQPPVAVRVVQPAAPPVLPSSMELPLMLGLGLAAGLVAGMLGALARNALDTSIKSSDQLRGVAGAPNLGTIIFDPQVPKRPLTVHEDPQAPRAEAFRQLRTNLQFIDVDRPHKIIVVTSAMPSEGKTTTLANLAIALATAGHRVLVVDADLRRPKLADLLGLDRSVGLTNVLSGRVAPGQVIQHWAGGVDVLPSGPLPPNPSELLGSTQMASALRHLGAQYDIVLVDTPPLLPVTDAAAVAPATDGVLLVCRFKTTREQLGAAVHALEAVSAALLGTVFSMVPATGPRAYAHYNSHYRTEGPTEQPASPVRRLPVQSTTRSAGAGAAAWEPPPARHAQGRPQ